MKSGSLGKRLIAIFLIAVVMGAGPGIFLVNPDPGDPEAKRFFLGMPIVYTWAVAWFLVQASCVLVAYRKLWSDPAPARDEEGADR